MVQITLIQIDNYGPWTVTPEPRREVDLQSLQSNLYADLCERFGSHDSLVFFSRFDNMVAVTDGMSEEDHERIQESIRNRYPVTISMSVADAETPKEAVHDATEALQETGSAQDSERREQMIFDVDGDGGNEIQVAHFDVNDVTGRFTDEVNAFDTMIHIESGYLGLMKYMWREYDSMSFFVGGDNIISPTRPMSREDFEDVIRHVEAETEVEIKVGAGVGETPGEAGMKAKIGLEECRENGTRVVMLD